MDNNEIKLILMNTYNLEEIHVSGDGNYFQIIAIDKMFSGMCKIQRQQIIYKPLMKYITNNSIHALSIKAYTPQEWKQDEKSCIL